MASYHLQVRLDEREHRLDAQGTIRWTNRSQAAVNDLWFHLYLNAFSHERTLFLRSTGGRKRGVPPVFGHVAVQRLTARELHGVDLWHSAIPHSPGDPNDQTDIRVPLPRPIEPEETLTLDIEFESQLPWLFERTGYANQFHFVAQWFPKLARLESDGNWTHFAFHPQSEFYADFGDYDISLDVPIELVVGATGERVEESTKGARKTVRYRANGVHDFVWTAWDEFVEQRERIGSVDVRVLYPRAQRANTERALRVLRFALPDFATRYGPYPYPTLTVVHPPEGAEAAGGMEYPTLITTGAPWYAPHFSRAIETVTVHELGHQWFYGMVATNEHDYPVLDEGLTTWAESLTMRRAFGPTSAIELPGLQVSGEAIRRAYAASHVHDEVVVQPAPDFASFSSIGALVYSKTGTTLRTLANVYGERKVERAIGAYAREHRFGHPTWPDLVKSFEEHVGQHAARQLEVALTTRGWVNYVAEHPRCHESEMSDNQADDQVTHRCYARVRRHGTLTFPVTIDLLLEDGSRVERHWDGQGAFTELSVEAPSPLVSVVVDPATQIALDTNLLDNAGSIRPGPSHRVLGQSALLAQALLGWVGP